MEDPMESAKLVPGDEGSAPAPSKSFGLDNPHTLKLCAASFVLGVLLPLLYLVATQPTGPPPASLIEEAPRSSPAPEGELCVTPAYPLEGVESDWNRIKRIPPPAQCTVRGLPIERLEPAYNFRRGYALGMTPDVEDKTHVLPYLRATRDLAMAARPRRVLLDFGGKTFESSVVWFLQFYPLAFSEIYVFEAVRGRFIIPANGTVPEEDATKSIDASSHSNQSRRHDLPNWVLSRVTLREEMVGAKDLPAGKNSVPTCDITRVMKEEMRLTREDTVVVKMDIELAEWDVLKAWLADPEMPHIVDELFVEVHYQDPSMAAFGWTWAQAPKREEAAKLFEELRANGFYAHPWP